MTERVGRGPDTWMPLYIGDYLADTLHLSAELHGAYLLMLMHAWRNGGAIPDDDMQLAAIAKLDASRWRKVKPVLARFFRVEDAEWRQKRLDIELATAIDTQQKKQAAGRAGANARYGNKHTDATADATAGATGKRISKADRTQWQTHAPSPSPKDTPPTPSAEAEHCGANGEDLLGYAPIDERTRIPHEQIIAAYHEILPMCPRVAGWSKKRQSLLKARWTENRERQSIEWWQSFFGWVAESKFLTGRVPPAPPRTVPFLAGIEWLLTEGNFLKVIEGGFNRDSS